MVPRLQWLSGECRTSEFRLLCRWFGQVLALRERFVSSNSVGFDPLGSNETASVGLLAAAASRSGLLTLTDYVSYKRGYLPGKRYRRGRCDLWVGDPRRDMSMAFEFKQFFYGAGTRSATIESQLRRACYDARQIDALEAHRRFGGLIMSLESADGPTPDSEARLIAIGQRTSYACRLVGVANSAWLFLQAI